MISVIIPVYKVENYLDECVQSVVNQTYKDLEIILVEDGSPDNCPKMCDDWAKWDSRIKVIHKQNGGLSDARNIGLNNAKGDYISFLDSDDYMDCHCLEKLLETLHENPDCSIVSCSHWLDKDGIIEPPFNPNWDFNKTRYIEPNEYADKMLLMESQHTAWGKLFKANVLKYIRYRKGCNNEDILFALDFYPIVERDKIRTVEIPDKLIYYRQRENSICHDKTNDFAVAEFLNRYEVIKKVKGKKPNVFHEYYFIHLKQLCFYIGWVLNHPEKYPFSYFSLCKKAWMYSNSYAKYHLLPSDYSTILHAKHLAPIVWLKYKLSLYFS